MHIESISGDAENTTASRGISRRSVMKVGAAAAWSVPLVQVVAAAPAHATSGQAAVLALSGASGQWIGGSSSTQFTLQSTIANTGGAEALSVQVTYTFPDTLGWSPSYVSATGGWVGSASGRVVTLTLATLAAGNSETPIVTLSSPANRKGSAITGIEVSATATGTNSPGTTVSVPAKP
jgi:hypothetical protein